MRRVIGRLRCDSPLSKKAFCSYRHPGKFDILKTDDDLCNTCQPDFFSLFYDSFREHNTNNKNFRTKPLSVTKYY